MIEKFYGWMFIVNAILLCAKAAMDSIIEHANLYGFCLAISFAIVGCGTVRSIYRDRLASC